MPRGKIRRAALRGLAVLGVLLAVLLIVVRLLYGGGEAYRDVTTEPRVPAGEVEVLVELDMPLGNVTSSADGRVFFNVHPFARADRFRDAFFFELVDGEPRPYPDAATQEDLKHGFGMNVDAQGRLWVISPATLDRDRTRLQAFDLATGERVFDHRFDDGVARFAQDLRVLSDGRHAILADTGALRFTAPSLLVVDLETRQARTVLEDDPSLEPQRWMIRTPYGEHTVAWGLIAFAVGVDGIALSPDEAWLYYAAISHDSLYRVPTDLLLDPSSTHAERVAAVERVGTKPLSDGIETTADGEVLVTDVEHGAVVGIRPDGRMRTLIRMDGIVWADGVNVAADGSVLLTDSGIPAYIDPLMRPPTRARLAAGAPYGLYRFRIPGSAGNDGP